MDACGGWLASLIPTVVQLTRRSKSPGATGVHTELLCQRLPLRARPVPDRHIGARVAKRPDDGAGRAPGAENERALAGRRLRECADQAIGVGVVRNDHAVGESERVRGADLARRVACAVGDGERRELVRDGDVDAGEALTRERADELVEALRSDLDRLVAPLAFKAEVGESGAVHRGRARMRDRLPEDGELRHEAMLVRGRSGERRRKRRERVSPAGGRRARDQHRHGRREVRPHQRHRWQAGERDREAASPELSGVQGESIADVDAFARAIDRPVLPVNIPSASRPPRRALPGTRPRPGRTPPRSRRRRARRRCRA